MIRLVELLKGLFDSPKTRSEETSAAVARKAASVLSKLRNYGEGTQIIAMPFESQPKIVCSATDMKAICASALTQTKEKKK